MIPFILNVLHSIPHFNFSFKPIKATFDGNWKSEYAQSLALVGAVVLSLALLLLLAVVITWVCQCCARADVTVKPRRRVRRLSAVLFIISLFCFFCIGFCLFGNDQVNRGVSTSIVSINDVTHQLKIAQATSGNLNEISRNASGHIKALEELISDKSKGVNETILAQMDTLITQLSDSIDSVLSRVSTLKQVLNDVSFLENAKMYAERIELERWIVLVVLPSIMLVVLFAGVISFCRQSKTGAVAFSGLGIVIFILGWIILALVLPLSVALADFCVEGGDFLAAKVSQPLLKTMSFYSECDPRPTHDNLPPHLGVSNMSEELSSMQAIKTQLDSLMDSAFNRSEDVQKASALLMEDGTRSLKAIGALESGLACYAYKDDMHAMKNGICGQALIGSAVLCMCLVLLGLFMFILLLIVSKSWNLFTRLGNDYIEVDEDDPFFPRTNDNIPHDIYGTHVFNPRTRERAEPSTGTTTATANGQSESDPLWNRGAAPTAPSQTLTRSPYDEHYGNYQDRYDV